MTGFTRLITTVLILCSFALGADNLEQLLDRGLYKQARPQIEQQFKANPNNAQNAYLLSRVRLVWHEVDDAIVLAERAVALDAKQTKYHVQLAAAAGEEAERVGVLKQVSLARSVKKELETAISLDPKNPDARFGMVQFYALAPFVLGGDKKKATALAEDFARTDPAHGYDALIALAEQRGDGGAVANLAKQAVEAAPNAYDGRVRLGMLFGSDTQRKYDVAEQQGREAIKLDSGRVGGYSVLAMALAGRENWAELDRALALAEKNVSDDLSPYYYAARTLLTNGKDLARAERYLRKYLTQTPDPFAPPIAQAHWRLGLVLEKLGRRPEAANEVQVALQIDPGLPDAKKDLKRLR
jgi:tetratricopeptide (TPR) repeat protein